jgi:hypothetical protein
VLHNQINPLLLFKRVLRLDRKQILLLHRTTVTAMPPNMVDEFVFKYRELSASVREFVRV